MAKDLEENVDKFSNNPEKGHVNECEDGQAEQKGGGEQVVGKNILGKIDQMVTESTSTTSGIKNEFVSLEHDCETQATKSAYTLRVPLQECTSMMHCRSGVVSVSQNKNLKGQWKQMTRMQ